VTGFLLLAFVILVAGLVSVPIAARYGLGSVLGYLLAGMAIAPLLSALDVNVEQLQVFAEFGVVMMLFIVGLELEPKTLWAMRGKLLGTGGGQVVLTTLAIAAVALIDGQAWQTALAIGMILTLSSTAIVVQSLTEKGLLKSGGGETAFSVLLFQDVAVIPMLALLPLLALPSLAPIAGEAAHHGLDLTAELPAALAAVARVAAVAAVVLIGIFLTRPVFRWIAAANLRELFTAAALVFVIGIALLMSLVGLSPALGTFLAGVVLANSEYRHELESDVDPFKGLLLGLFFITVGASVDFSMLAQRWSEVLFWALVTIAVKIAALLLVGRLSGLKREGLWLFALALPQAGEFGFVLIAFAVGNAILPGPLADLLLLVVAATMLATPLLFILYDKVIARFYCGRPEVREADTIEERNPIIVAGRGRVGGIVDRMLDAAGYRTTVIDYNADHLENLKKFGVKTYFGDATRPDLLASAGIAQARLLVVALDEREQIDKLVRYAVANFPNLHVIARAKDRHHVYNLWAMGCRDVIRETYDSALRMGRSAYEALGIDRQSAQAMTDAWEERDRIAMREVADLYRLDIPAHENAPFVAKIKEMRAEWDPKLRDMMDEIIARGRSS
jgi:monovalent cation:H+ antiporter-2, CPA2 family